MHALRHIVLAFFLALPAVADTPLPDPLSDADFIPFDPEQAELGRFLFYDPILSGNRNISCGTCHHHDHGSSDGLSLGIGEGGTGLGEKRVSTEGPSRILKRIPRNAQALWNLGAKEIEVMFHDGRLSVSDQYGNGFDSPAEEWLPDGLDTLLAAQALFPLAARFEMGGDPQESEVGGAIHDRIDAAWPIIAERVRAVEGYRRMFPAAFNDLSDPAQINITHIARAIAAFVGTEWRNHDSPFDAYLEGDTNALSAQAKRGMDLFYGRANCASCHSGPLLSDQEFHALGLPAFGPGKTRRFDPQPRDVGRMGESDLIEDAYRFRTPMLRNVALTAPYGHNGAYATLEGILRHHLDPEGARKSWRPEDARLPEVEWLAAVDFAVQQDAREMTRQARALDIQPLSLNDDEIADILAFLDALTGVTAENRPLGRPESVPSGLPVD